MTDDRREWYIYVLRDPRDNAVRYVGFTIDVGKRLCTHISEAIKGVAKTHKNNWINVLVSLDLQPIIEVIERGAGEWQSVEQYWIRHYRMNGTRLTNSTDGGDGVLGYVWSEDAREKLSQAAMGRKPSSEAREKMSKAAMKRKASDETRERMSKGQLGRKMSPESVEKTRQANLGRKQSPEHIEKHRQAMTGRKQSAEHIKKRMLARWGHKHTPESREKMRETQTRERVGETPPQPTSTR